MTPFLRPFTADDDEALIRWFPDARSLRRFGGPSLLWPLDRGQLEAIRADPGLHAFTLWAGEPPAPVGHVELRRTGPQSARLARVGIAPARRGEGLGRALVAAALAEAARLGCVRVELGVYADNAVARALYESFGFAPAGGPDAEGIVPMRRDEAAGQGLEPQLPEPESGVLPITPPRNAAGQCSRPLGSAGGRPS